MTVQEMQEAIDALQKQILSLVNSPGYFNDKLKQAQRVDLEKQIETLQKSIKTAEKTKGHQQLEADRELIWSKGLSKHVFLRKAEKDNGKPMLLIRKNDVDMSMYQLQFNVDDLTDKIIGNPNIKSPIMELLKTFDTKKDGGMEENLERGLKFLINYIRIHTKNTLSSVPNWSNHIDDPCLHYIPLEIEEGPTPCWDQFLDRVDLKDEFLAFIWSIFDVRDKGRQIFWLRDSGAGGKSSVVRALEAWLGEAARTISLDNLKNTHGAEALAYRRLLIDPDSNLVYAISDSLVHKITGADTVNVNPKGRSMYSVNMYAKILFMSNYLPQISADKKNEKTRLIFSELRPRQGDARGQDIGWENGLLTEKKALLFKAKQAYERLVRNFEISTERVNYSILETGEIEFIYEFMEKKGYVLNPKATILRSVFIAELEKAHKLRSTERMHSLTFRETYTRFLIERGVTHKRTRNPVGGEITHLIGIGVVPKEEPEDVIL
jgi:hypothetical protein